MVVKYYVQNHFFSQSTRKEQNKRAGNDVKGHFPTCEIGFMLY